MVIHFDLPVREARIKEIEEMMVAENFWNDQRKAQSLVQEMNTQKNLIKEYQALLSTIQEINESVAMLKDDYSEELHLLIEDEYLDFEKNFEKFEINVLLSHPYDQHNAIVELHPGAGGTESQDWASMLYRMYTRYAARKGYNVRILDLLEGEEAGLKSVSFLVEGPLAYGYLKGERGIHRLVRISPFNAAGKRMTSFASVEVTPEFNDDIQIEIRPEDIQIDTHRASGAGGQHINKTDSAVRITHLPTGIVTSCQSERSQLQNKEQALNMLKSKLYARYIQEQESRLASIKGVQMRNEWGSQIRNYVFCPYTLVKDVRTGYEETNVGRVMDGEIDEFIYAYLKSQI